MRMHTGTLMDTASKVRTLSVSSTWRKKKVCFACRRCQHQHNNGSQKKLTEDFWFAHPTQEEARQGVAQHAPAKERDAPSPPSSEALCWTGSRNPGKAFGQGRRTTGPKDRQDSATNQWLFSLLKDLKACRQTLCSKEGNRSANTGSAKEKASGSRLANVTEGNGSCAECREKYTESGSAADGTCQCTDAQELR